MTKTEVVLAVVGGGSVATSFMYQLARQQRAGGIRKLDELLVFEPRPQPGAGAAYQQDTESNLLNTRAVGMSALHSDPTHFYNWALNNEQRWRPRFPRIVVTPEAFLPRALFGLYMQDVYDEAAEILRTQGVKVSHLNALVSDVRQHGTSYTVLTEHGRSYDASFVVMAIGNTEGMQFDHLRDRPGYFSTPYPCTRLTQEIDPDKSVCIIGSSLSAIDAAVSLADAGHRGKIVMVSRNGRLPSVRGEHNLSRRPQLLMREKIAALAQERGNQLRLQEVAELLLQEMELCEGAPVDLADVLRPSHGPHRYLDLEIEASSTDDRSWQTIVYGLNDTIDLIWHYLPDEDRRVFERDFKSQWLSYRVSFPLENARKVQQLLHSDQLTVYAGCADLCFNQALGQFVVNVIDSRKSFCATIYSDYLVNAAGYSTNARQCRSDLIRNCVASGLARPDEFGGIEADFDTSQALSRSRNALRHFYVLGSMVSGTYFWTNAMNVNCRLAAGVAEHVLTEASSTARSVAQPRSAAHLQPYEGALSEQPFPMASRVATSRVVEALSP